jgi:phage-related minor tail protein
MADLAQLSLEINSEQVKTATADLDNFQKSADGAAQAADKFNETASSGATKTGAAVTTNADRITSAAAQQTGAWGAVQGAVGSVSAETLGLITVMAGGAVAIGGAAAVIAYHWSGAQEVVSQSLIGIGAKTGETMQSINAFSVANATATGLSIGQARDVATEFTKTGAVAVSGLEGLGAAVEGYSVLTGETATKATQALAKALSGDLVKGAQELNTTYGFLNGTIQDQIQALVQQGDRTGAVQVIINAMAGDNQKAADSVGVLSKAWSALGNAMSFVANLPAHFQAPPLPQQIASKQTELSNLQNGGQSLGSDMQTLNGGLDQTAAIAKAQAELAALQAEMDKVNAGAVTKQLDALSVAGNAVVNSIIPQIGQIDKLKEALATLQAAQNTPGVKQGSTGANDNAAVTAIQNQIVKLQDAEGQAARYNEQVKLISGSWGDVGQSTALVLQKLNGQSPVAAAIAEQAISKVARLDPRRKERNVICDNAKAA